MKKIIILFISLLLLCGCSSKEVVQEKKDIKVEPEEVITYTDLNNTPIGIYSLSGNQLTRLNTINKKLVVEEDICVFQIYPSNEEIVSLNDSFGKSFYDEWMKYNLENNLKIGFNIKFTKSDGESISYNIFSPNETFNHWEQLMNYLYDDYANLGKGFYSHIENDQYSENTLFTAFKMQSSYSCSEIASKIELTVFTYDDQEDFDENQEYRGNSSYTLNICVEGNPC